jgi:hypothetical protein
MKEKEEERLLRNSFLVKTINGEIVFERRIVRLQGLGKDRSLRVPLEVYVILSNA